MREYFETKMIRYFLNSEIHGSKRTTPRNMNQITSVIEENEHVERRAEGKKGVKRFPYLYICKYTVTDSKNFLCFCNL